MKPSYLIKCTYQDATLRPTDRMVLSNIDDVNNKIKELIELHNGKCCVTVVEYYGNIAYYKEQGMTREDIEATWVHKSDYHLEFDGLALCSFTHGLDLHYVWNDIWNTQDKGLINQYFRDERYEDDELHEELCYLTRALSLNMLLDDNLEE